MQYIWQHRLWPGGSLTACAGERVEVLDPGTVNGGSGPDFFNAKVLVDRQLWAGSVEMHVLASDWHRHGHDTDPAYLNVVLHVVRTDDDRINVGEPPHTLPQVVLECPENFMDTVNSMINNPLTEYPCAAALEDIPPLALSDWIEALGLERLQRKADDVMHLLEITHGDWREALYITLARALGMGANADAMERLARATPLMFFKRHADLAHEAEALLLGRAGLLEENPSTPEEEFLVREYKFYSAKFAGQLPPFDAPVWQKKVRPANSPRARITQLARLATSNSDCISSILGVKRASADPKTNAELFPDWLPTSVRENLTINVAAPCIYAYGQMLDDTDRQDAAVNMLLSLSAERNSIISNLPAPLRARCRKAFDSQAFIQLHNVYCTRRSCLRCRLGHRILARAACPGVTR